MRRICQRKAALTMLTPRPTTRPALSGSEIFARYFDPLASRLRLLGVLYPADPFIARERCDILPERPRRRFRSEHLA